MNYELLRSFDLEAAKRGEPICDEEGRPLSYIAGPDNSGLIVFDRMGEYFLRSASDLRMAPLAWVEEKPVYKGDVLYHKAAGKGTVIGDHRHDDLTLSYASFDAGAICELLSWNPTKVKREGWVNVYGVGTAFIYSTEREANDRASDDRIACVRIEWKEPA